MTEYHLFKSTRDYFGVPYCGATSGGVPASFDSLDAALAARADFCKRNPVGWDIYDAETGKPVGEIEAQR